MSINLSSIVCQTHNNRVNNHFRNFYFSAFYLFQNRTFSILPNINISDFKICRIKAVSQMLLKRF